MREYAEHKPLPTFMGNKIILAHGFGLPVMVLMNLG
jgi:hypothetical protein